jgi:hypothetical protein
MDSTSNSKRKNSRKARALAGGSLAAAIVLIMLIAASTSAVPRGPEISTAPDLVINPASIVTLPDPLVEGVPATVTCEVSNNGQQNAYSFMVSLWIGETEVANDSRGQLGIGYSWEPILEWTPSVPGSYEMSLEAWYGPTSDKPDVKWADNTAYFNVTVLSRPDAHIESTDLTFTADDPAYVVDGDTVVITAVVHNEGTGDISSCNVTLWEGSIGGKMVAIQPGVTIPGSGQVPVVFPWDTTGWSGKRRLIVDVTAVKPNETDLHDNTAFFDLKVHTEQDRLFIDKDNEIVSEFKVQFFITIEATGELTITPEGNATIHQDFDEQYDILVKDGGNLTIDGGLLMTERNFSVILSDSAKLNLINGAMTNVRVIASGNCDIWIIDSELDSPSFEMDGGTLTIINSSVRAGWMDLNYVDIHIERSQVIAGDTVYIRGMHATIRDTFFSATREFETFQPAVEVYPSLADYNAETNEVEGLPPALVAIDGAVVGLINVSVETQILITAEDNYYWSANRLGAEGRTSIIYLYRYLLVEVRDWSDQVVPDAEVEVMDYFNEEIIVNGTTNETGDVILEVLTDYITEAQKPFVGNVRVRATAFGRTSEDQSLSHSKYSDMGFAFNTMTVGIEMPPNPYTDPVTFPEKMISRFVEDDEIENGDSSLDRNIWIDNVELTLRDTRFTLEQDYDFQWYILITGTSGALKLINSTLQSDFLFTIFVEKGTLNMTHESAMPGVRIIASDNSRIQIIDSSLTGGIYAECLSVEIVRSQLLLRHTHLEATTVSIAGGYVHEQQDMLIKATSVHLVDVELTADYELFEDVGFFTLRELVRYFGWSLLNDEEYLTNISKGFFVQFASESLITIDSSTLAVSNCMVYAAETNILVRRNPGASNQAKIIESWIGGLELKVVSDDLYARYSNFNRPLDDFEGTDHAILESVQVPWIECSGSAIVERFWFLTVNGFDGAGSVVYQALLEVYSTETNKQLLPVVGTEDLDSSKTDDTGSITVAVKANHTDASGDYFVGSVYFHLKYDGPQFADDPIFTPDLQMNIKRDEEVNVYFEEIIQPPQKEIMYAIYNMTYAGPSQDLRLFNHTYNTLDEAVEFLSQVHGFAPERVRENWTMVRNTYVNLTFFAQQKINNEWLPLNDGSVKVYILEGWNAEFDANRVATYKDNVTKMVYTIEAEDIHDGIGNVTIWVPEDLQQFQIYIAISGGKYDPNHEPVPGSDWNFSVKPPQTIQIPDPVTLSPDRVIVGEEITVSGYVRYIFTGTGVEGAEVTISGAHISTTFDRTDVNGWFSIRLQAPILVMNNLTLVIQAQDPRTDENFTYLQPYNVLPDTPDEVVEETPWALIWTVIILVVLGFAIAFGAVMMYRRHYGEVVECGECGAFIPSNSTACPKCGIEFETDLARCSECEAWIPANSSSCPVCGTAFTIESLEEQVAREEADEELTPVDQITTSTATMAPLTLESASQATKWGDREEKRRRRIKKRVKKRLTVTDAAADEVDDEDSKDLFIGDEGDETRLPGLDVDESALDDEDLSRLLPTEDMLKDLMLTSDDIPAPDEGMDDELDTGEPDEGEADLELEEIPMEDGELPEAPETDLEAPEDLEEIPAPEEPSDVEEDLEAPEEEPSEDLDIQEEDAEPVEEDTGEGRELLSELGLVAETPERLDLDDEPGPEDESALSGLLAEEEESKEAPKLCPNCGGNWILYKDGEYTCRICGETW